MIRRGQIVVVDFAATDPAARVRPALIIQNDRDNGRMRKTIVAQITSNLKRAAERTHLLIDPGHPDWMVSGLRLPSLVSCSNIATIHQDNVVHALGSLSAPTMKKIEECLRAALSMP